MAAYYNENDPFASAWLRELIKAGHIAPGDVDDRSILEVQADEIKGYTQHHFFAGIGGWAYAARLAGWPDERPLFTGSPPCQPFSVAGKQLGKADDRHLAPHFLALVAAIRPPFLAGEQVAAAVNKDAWLDDLLDALEREGYATGAIVLPACSVGSAHIRQRIFFVGRLEYPELQPERSAGQQQKGIGDTPRAGEVGRLGNSEYQGLERQPRHGDNGNESRWIEAEQIGSATKAGGFGEQPGPANAPEAGWNDPDWLFCRDGKWRPVESGTFPLANGVPARVGRLRGYGNAIVPQVAAEVLRELLEARR